MVKNEKQTGNPESRIWLLPNIVRRLILDKREFLAREVGDASDFGIIGVILLGDRRSMHLLIDYQTDAVPLSTISDDRFSDDFVDQLSVQIGVALDPDSPILISQDRRIAASQIRTRINERFLPGTPYVAALPNLD